MNRLPYSDIPVAGQSGRLAGRLNGQMFADQGAAVLTACIPDPEPSERHLNRGRSALAADRLSETRLADIVIPDGPRQVDRLPGQIVLRAVAALSSTNEGLPARLQADAPERPRDDPSVTEPTRFLAQVAMAPADKLDAHADRPGLGRDGLNPAIRLKVLTACRGDPPVSRRQSVPGCDPDSQGKTGIRQRLGQQGCPSLHGGASCVDPLWGCLGGRAGLTARDAQQRRGDGWTIAEADHDPTDALAGKSRAEALRRLTGEGILASPVKICRERAKSTPTTGVIRREDRGWTQGGFGPSRFAGEDGPFGPAGAAHRIGSRARAVLGEFGHGPGEIDDLPLRGIAGRRTVPVLAQSASRPAPDLTKARRRRPGQSARFRSFGAGPPRGSCVSERNIILTQIFGGNHVTC